MKTSTDVARLYHRLSSYDLDRHWTEPPRDPLVRQDFVPMRASNLPWPVKRYGPQCPVVVLPPAQDGSIISAAAVLCGELPSRSRQQLDLNDISAILFQTAAVIRTRRTKDGNVSEFRAASSAGNRHPVETYLCSRGIKDLPDGVWHYHPRHHALTMVGAAPTGDQSAVVICGVPWRTCWKYAERGYRHVWWDCGTMLSQAIVASRCRGVDARVHTAFVDDSVRGLVGATREEIPLAVLALGPGIPAWTASAPAVGGHLGPGSEVFPLVDAIHEAGNLASDTEVKDWLARQDVTGDPTMIELRPGVGGDSCGELIRNRRSARRFDPSQAISLDQARWLIEVASASPPEMRFTPGIRLLIHSVAERLPGVYRVDAEGPYRIGSLERAVSQTLCLDQPLGHDAGMLFCFTASAEHDSDARTYRSALLAAGMAMGRLYLAAGLLGLGCSGLTMVDALLPMVLTESVEGLAICALGAQLTGERLVVQNHKA